MRTEHMSGTRHGLYGPTVRRTYRLLPGPPIARPEFDPRTGLCSGLPAPVADRWFGGRVGSFEAATARTMCARCPVAAACLAAEIAVPRRADAGLMRGGAHGHEITAMRYQREREGTSPMRLAEAYVATLSAPLVGSYGKSTMRRGDFPTVHPMEV